MHNKVTLYVKTIYCSQMMNQTMILFKMVNEVAEVMFL